MRSEGDVATRMRLFSAATRLFAERGFRRVTVREICREAGANLASVNYHFGDKMQLYLAVAKAAAETARALADEALSADPGAGDEERLRHYIRVHLTHTTDAASRRAWIIRSLFRHEMAEPTAAGPYMVEHALLPRMRYLRELVARLLGAASPDDEDVERCAVSIQSQCLSQLIVPRALRLRAVEAEGDLDAAADHILRFSLAGLRAAAGRRAGRRGR